MKNIFLIIILYLFTNSILAQDCLNFSGSYNLNRWSSVATGAHALRSDAIHGNYLELKDASGSSWEYNTADFGGNWLTKGQNGCLCFDYNVDWSGCNAATVPVKAPKIAIYNGTHRAAFIGNSGNPDIQNNVWRNFCLPIGLAAGTNLPSNIYGSWTVYQGTTVLTGLTAAAAWNVLIQNVTGLNLYTDYNSFPGELVRFDNFCWNCGTQPCGITISATITNEVCSNRGDAISVGVSGASTSFTIRINGNLATPSNTNLSAGTYNIQVTDSNNCVQNKTVTIENSVCPPDRCCKNEFSVVTPSVVPENMAGNGYTYSVEAYNVNVPNTIPITEIRVNVESFELISKYEDCLKCYNPPTSLGSMVGLWNIGSGANTLTNQNIFPADWTAGNGNPNEATWSNPRGVMLNTNDAFRLIYIFPEASNIPCCVDSAKICLRISYTDVNCGRCELRTCSTVPLTNLAKENAETTNGRGKLMKPQSLEELLKNAAPAVKN